MFEQGRSWALLFFLVGQAASAASPAPGPESTLHFHYQVRCDAQDTKSFPGIIAEISIGTRRLRSYLLRYRDEEALALGAPSETQLAGMKIRYLPHPGCALQFVETRINTGIADSLAKLHSPLLILRPDQNRVPERDIPFHIGYSRMPRQNGFVLRYTIFFSNETDYGPLSTTKSKSQAVYGRRTDIEWIYEVEFDRTGNAVARRYQGGIFLGMGHSTKAFRGKMLAGTQHPVLYDIAKHNVFSDRPHRGQNARMASVHPIPTDEIKSPDAREDWMWRNPWSFDLSDRELRRTGRLSYPSEDYVYTRIAGNYHGGGLSITGTDMIARSIFVSKLGESLWGSASYAGFRLRDFPTDKGKRDQILYFTPSSLAVSITSLQFFKLVPDSEVGFRKVEISSLFECQAGHCRY